MSRRTESLKQIGALAILSGAFVALGPSPRATAQSLLYDFPGPPSQTDFGRSVGDAGDVNRDGLPDFIVGSPLAAAPAPRTGEARVFSGRDGSLLRVFPGIGGDDFFGFSVDGAGDVDCDGFADVIVGAPQPSFPGTNTGGGYAQVFSGRTGTLLKHLAGAGPVEAFGFSVSGAGDVNGDGAGDVIVGGPEVDLAQLTSGGLARIFFSQAGVLDQSITVTGPSGSSFGLSVSGAGDVDGDGRDDVVVGAEGTFNGAPFVRVFSLPLGAPFQQLFQINGGRGFPVSGAGDVNGDGLDDVLVGGDPAQLFAGPIGVPLPLATMPGGPGSSSGRAVSGAGDVNGDGFDDVAIGVPDAGAGRVDIYSGEFVTSALLGTPPSSPILLTSLGGDQPGDGFGSAIALAGDVTGDGVDDLVIGAPQASPLPVPLAFGDGIARVFDFGPPPPSQPLFASKPSLRRCGGAVDLQLDAGPALAGATYVVLGSLSGTSSGIVLDSVLIPLVIDSYAVLSLTDPGAVGLENSIGTLDSQGRANAQLVLEPPEVQQLTQPTQLDLAFIALGPQGAVLFASNPVAVQLIP